MQDSVTVHMDAPPDEVWDALAALPFATDDPEASRAYKPG